MMKGPENHGEIKPTWFDQHPKTTATLKGFGIALAVIAGLAVIHTILHATVGGYANFINGKLAPLGNVTGKVTNFIGQHPIAFGVTGGALVLGGAAYVGYGCRQEYLVNKELKRRVEEARKPSLPHPLSTQQKATMLRAQSHQTVNENGEQVAYQPVPEVADDGEPVNGNDRAYQTSDFPPIQSAPQTL